MSDKAGGAENQQGRFRDSGKPSETIRQTPLNKRKILAYLNGAIHDASLNKKKRIRFAQKDKLYIQITQKNHDKIKMIKELLKELEIGSGKIHNPSQEIDPDYWRIFISTKDHKKFAEIINSYHPLKAKIFRQRMKI